MTDRVQNCERFDREHGYCIEGPDCTCDPPAGPEDASSNRVQEVVRALRDKDCPYLGNYKLGYDAALDDVLRELVVYAIPNSAAGVDEDDSDGPMELGEHYSLQEQKELGLHATPNSAARTFDREKTTFQAYGKVVLSAATLADALDIADSLGIDPRTVALRGFTSLSVTLEVK